MKDNLLEFLFNLFETSLSQLNDEQHPSDMVFEHEEHNDLSIAIEPLKTQIPHKGSVRVLTYEEQIKMTKPSYQFLMRLKLWGILNNDFFELILHQIQCSESAIVTLKEAQWIIKQTLSPYLSEKHNAFLELVLCQTKDEFTTH